jgi:ankyrin repeat protein
VNVNVQDRSGQAPIHLAARAGHASCIKVLVTKCRVNVNVQDRSGQAPIHWSCVERSEGAENCFIVLIDLFKVDVNVLNCDGKAPVHLAIENRIESSMQLLLQFGADVINSIALGCSAQFASFHPIFIESKG